VREDLMKRQLMPCLLGLLILVSLRTATFTPTTVLMVLPFESVILPLTSKKSSTKSGTFFCAILRLDKS
jgi:hypothetical protein